MKSSFLWLLAVASLHAETQITWKRQQLHGEFYSEGVAIGDINGDGKPDVVAGPFWWEGPAFEKRHAFYEPKVFNINGYSDNFFAYVWDFNGDGRNDILVLGFPGKEARLYLNPGTSDDKPWPVHVVADVVDNESPVFTDITGDGKPELVCSLFGRFGYYEPDWSKPTQPWNFVAVSDDRKAQKFTHGLGVGDVNGDGKPDLLEARGWWEHTASGPWIQHPLTGIGGGAQMFAYDFDGNGTRDVFSSLAAHRYGTAVFLQGKPGAAEGWSRRMLAGETPAESPYGIVFSQPHAAALADMNGDGILDVVTGKRYWAHNGHDPDERGARVVYWYETVRDGKGGVDFVPHLVDAESGVGVDVQVGDVSGDGLPDIVSANKAGVFILTQVRATVSAAEAQQLAPKPLYGPALTKQQDYAHGLSPKEALKAMQLPGGFKADLVAAEPELVQPIAFTFDERGRIWVVEGMSYPQPRQPGAGLDRILIFEDKDGDGTYETRKVFCEGISLASGIEVGFGGVWVGAAPYLMFIPDRDHDDKPDAEDASFAGWQKVPGLKFTAYAVLDGWGSQDTHETLNSFVWGPDGWLYGCHGVFTHSKVGRPGVPDAEREPINAGVWRYHPVRRVFEVFAHGTSNPWGLDYDRGGEFFVTACVIPHLFHIVPGGRYQRQAGQHFNAQTYEDIKTIANHAHYAGNQRPDVSFDKTTGAGVVNADTNALGGGHAHCGLAIYQASLFPATYRDTLIFGNLHGHRLVSDFLDVQGSTFVGRHGSDFLRANDMNFVPVTQKVGPDGALYVSDWSDKQVCHRGSGAVELWDRSNGRMYRVSSVGWKAWKGNLAAESDADLARRVVQMENEWFSRMARRILMERSSGAGGQRLDEGARTVLRSVVKDKAEPVARRLRALWCMGAVNAIDAAGAREFLSDGAPEVRAWAVRFVVGGNVKAGEFAADLGKLGSGEGSAVVRRELASSLQRLPLEGRRALASALLRHGEDKDDPCIPLLIWYGIEPLVGVDFAAGLELARGSKIPKVTELVYRRLSSDEAGRISMLGDLAKEPDAARRETSLTLIVGAARTAGKLKAPAEWSALEARLREGATPKAVQLVRELSALFGDAGALGEFRTVLGDGARPTAEREQALAVLLQAGDQGSAAAVLGVVGGKETPSPLRRKAIQALAVLAAPEAPSVLGGLLGGGLSGTEQGDAINTLASSSAGGRVLLKAVESKRVAATVISPFLVRQLQALQDKEVDALIAQVVGTANASRADLPQQRAKYQALLTPAKLKAASLEKGRATFGATCGLCHRLFGEGQDVGPDLTGSNRGNLDYVLDNVLDPNALIGKDYQLNIFTMADGRVMTGIVKQETGAVYRLAMPGGVEFTIDKAGVRNREVSKVSTMPEGLFDALQPEQVVDLVAYLQSGTAGATGSKGAGVGGGKGGKVVKDALEGETLEPVVTGGSARPQAMGGFSAGAWTGNQHLWWVGGKVGDRLTLKFPVAKAGRQRLMAVFTKAPDYAQVSLKIDGKPCALGEVDLYDRSVVNTPELPLGEFEMQAGAHTLEVTITGHNSSARPSLLVGFDYLRLE